jgi:hypothetical protein
MAYIPEHARPLGLESTDWPVLPVGFALAGASHRRNGVLNDAS